jgi:uncharacterized Zn-binding protein involved in type VI secretion
MSRFGTFLFGATEFLRRVIGGARLVACLGDGATHSGVIISSGQDGTVKVGGVVVAVHGAMFACNLMGHGTTAITPLAKRSFINGKLIITKGSVAGCGAKMLPPNRGVFAG